MPVATTERLIVRRVTIADAPAFERIFCDARVMRFGGLRSPQWVRRTIEEMVNRHYGEWGYGRWAVVLKTTGEVIGTVGISRYPDRLLAPGDAELGYRFAHAFWGRGFATEAAAVTCNDAFAQFDVAQVIAYVDPNNAASVRVVQKIGMRQDGWVQLQGHPREARFVMEPPT